MYENAPGFSPLVLTSLFMVDLLPFVSAVSLSRLISCLIKVVKDCFVCSAWSLIVQILGVFCDFSSHTSLQLSGDYHSLSGRA